MSYIPSVEISSNCACKLQMRACHTAHVSVEEIDSGRHGTRAVTSDPLRALLETWSDHELQGVLYETNAPPLWDPTQPTFAQLPCNRMVDRSSKLIKKNNRGIYVFS